MTNTYVRIYAFKVKPGASADFEEGWADLTEIIYQHAGSLGSRLHRSSPTDYIAYAEWPSKSVWEAADAKLPAEAEEARNLMRASCEKVETIHELDTIINMLQAEPY